MFSMKTIQNKLEKKDKNTRPSRDSSSSKRKKKKGNKKQTLKKKPAAKLDGKVKPKLSLKVSKCNKKVSEVKNPTRAARTSPRKAAQTDVNRNALPASSQTGSSTTSASPTQQDYKPNKRKKKRKAKYAVNPKLAPKPKKTKTPETKPEELHPPSTSKAVLYVKEEGSGGVVSSEEETGVDSQECKWDANLEDSLNNIDGWWSGKENMMECSANTSSESGSKEVGSDTDGTHDTTHRHHMRNKTGDTNRTSRKSCQRRHERSEERDSDVSECLVGECLAVTVTERDSVVAALPQDATLYLQGSVVICPLLGTVEILGHVLHQGQKQPICSLPTCALLGITVTQTQQVDTASDALSTLPSHWVEEVKEKNMPVVVLEVEKYVSPRVRFLSGAGWKFLGECRERQPPWDTLKATLITPGNCHKYLLTNILPQWKEAADTVATTWRCGSVPCVVVCGGQGVGKSTFFKYLTNTLLSAQPSSGVVCIDLDLGQPELSLSTSVSITHLVKPLLGPAYTHEVTDVSSHFRQILVGAVSPQFVLHEYLAAVQELCTACENREMPVVINTMGWTRGTGLGIMLDVLRLARPTHVIQIQGRKAGDNYAFVLLDSAVMSAREGIITRGTNAELHYSVSVLPSVKKRQGPHMCQPRTLREIRVMAQGGRIMEEQQQPLVVPWKQMALHVCGEQVPRDRILQVLNGQLVALCGVPPASIHTPHPDLPSLLTHDGDFGELLGWGVILAIDPLACTLHLATCLSSQQLMHTVNALVMPKIHLPVQFYKMYSLGSGPYLQEERRVGANRLRVGRRIKPRSHKHKKH